MITKQINCSLCEEVKNVTVTEAGISELKDMERLNVCLECYDRLGVRKLKGYVA